MANGNEQLVAARERTESPNNPGLCLSRGELADLVAAWLHRYRDATVTPDASWVGKLERGEITWPRRPQREALRAVLDAPSDEALGFFDRRRAVVVVKDVDRRDFIRGFGAAAALSPIAAALDGLPPVPVPARVGVPEIDQVHDAAAAFSGWDHAYGSGPTRAAILAQLRWSAGLLDVSVPARLRARLHSAVGYLGQVCGMVAFDAYQHDDSRRILRLALMCAEEAGDWHLRAKVFSALARQAIWVGDPDEGLTYTEQALVRSDRLTATERAMLHTARARALAKLHRANDTRAAVGAADDAFARSDPAEDPPWMAYYDAAQHNGDTGHALWDLAIRGHQADAGARLAAAVEGHSAAFARSRAISGTKLASLTLATGDPHEGAAIGAAALESAGAVRSRRLADDLRELARYAEPHGQLDDVDQLRHDIALAVVAS